MLEHPEHDPWAPLELDQPLGWATGGKLAALRQDRQACHAVLTRAGISVIALPPIGEKACRRPDRLRFETRNLSPAQPEMTCALALGLEFWLRHGLDAAATSHLGSPIARIEHFGTYSCRRLNNRAEGNWSEHATANAIDISAFVLANGQRVSVRDGWVTSGPEATFLREARKAACAPFATVLSPEYNAAHADHFHLDQATRRGRSICR